MFATTLATHKYWLSTLYSIDFEAAEEGKSNVMMELWARAADVSDSRLHSLEVTNIASYTCAVSGATDASTEA
jgi:hypothetical protein